MSPRRGPELPYSMVAGVTPWGKKWIVASAKMAAATFAPDEPKVRDSFRDVLDDRPSFVAVVVNAPIGYQDAPGMGHRECDDEARALLGKRRGLTVHDAPTRASIEGVETEIPDRLDAVTATLMPRYREVALEMSSFRQRVVYSGNPELSFYQLNDNRPMLWSKRSEEGRAERREVLIAKIPGINRILDFDEVRLPLTHLYDAAALLWTARRVFGHAAKRIPSDGVWDSEGLRTEMVL